MKLATKQYPAHSPDAVLAAAQKAAESLGHKIERVDPEKGLITFETGGSGGVRAGTKMMLSVHDIQGTSFASVNKSGMFGGSKAIPVGTELFKAMDVILA